MAIDSNTGQLILPIGIHDLSSILTNPSLDLGDLVTDPDSIFNIWAQKKFIRKSNIGNATDAQRLSACFGLSIPRYTSNDFKTHYSDPWTYLRPRGVSYDERFHIPDMAGYQPNCHWFDYGSTSNYLSTIFNGGLTVPSQYVFAGDTITFSIQCCEDPDAGEPGLLYPYSFLGQGGNFDLSTYYMGIALLDSQNVLRVKTGDQMNTHHTLYDVDTSMSETIPAAAANGTLIAIPVLATQQATSWESSQGGYLISLNGAHLTLTKRSSTGTVDTSVTITVEANRVRLDFSIQNVSSQAITVSKIHGFLLSTGSYANEADDGYPAPAFIDPDTEAFIWSTWQSNPNTIDILDTNHHGDLNIYLSDRTGNAYNPDYVSAYGLNVMGGTTQATAGFYYANGNSNVLARGSSAVTWTQYINHTSDDYGDYSENAFFILCLQISPNITDVRQYSIV